VTSQTFAPRPGAAPLRRMVLAQGLLECRLLLRNGEQLLLALVIPLLLLLVGAYGPIDVELAVLVPGILALAVLSTSFTSLAIATGFERRYGVLKRLGASPLPRTGLLAGKAIAVLLVELLQFVVLGLAGWLVGWRPDWSGLGTVLLFVAVGTAAFCALGLLLAGLLRAEATLAAANLVYVVLLVGGAVVVPAESYPGVLPDVLAWSPSAALAEGLRDGLAGAGTPWPALAVLAGWLLAAAAVTAKTFRWD
jgi:ABC-2 type transport system permease protein